MQSALIAGDSLDFTTRVANYPPGEWVLKYRLVPRSASGTPIVLEATAEEGDCYRIQAAPVVTAAWAPGPYSWTSWVEKSGARQVLEQGSITIRPDPATVSPGHDGRSLAQRALDDAREAFAKWTPTTRRYRIGEREMEFGSTADIVQVISFWELEVKREQQADRLARGLPNPRRAYVRMHRG